MENSNEPEESEDAVVDDPTTGQLPPNCIAVGSSGIVCKTDIDTVLKYPKLIPHHNLLNEFHRECIAREKSIYERLGNVRGIIPYLGVHDEETGAIELEYAEKGTLEEYIQTHDPPDAIVRDDWVLALMDTYWDIYSRRVLHRDIKPSNILVQDERVRLKVFDFGDSEIYPLDADMGEIYAQDPMPPFDLLGLGCIVYSIVTWEYYFFDYFGENRWPWIEELPKLRLVDYEAFIEECFNPHCTWESVYDT